MLSGIHTCIGDWVVGEVEQYIELNELLPTIEARNPVLISHSEIGWKCMNSPDDKINHDNGLRYGNADIDFPCILAEDAPNPAGKKYRMVDGSHRITKIKKQTNKTESYFYILTKDEFYSHLKNFRTVKGFSRSRK